MEKMNEFDRILHELVLNWKLRLVVSALFTMIGLALLVSIVSGLVMDLSLQDKTIVGTAVFVVMIPIYLIIADLPDIDEATIASMLNELVPELNQNADIVLKPLDTLDENDRALRREVESFFKQDKLYRFLPNRPIKQAIVIMIVCLSLALCSYLYFAGYSFMIP